MPHLGNYGGKIPTKKEKREAIAMHKMPDGHMMKNSQMKKVKKRIMTSDGYMK